MRFLHSWGEALVISAPGAMLRIVPGYVVVYLFGCGFVVKNKQIADILLKFADQLASRGDNPYRVRAYRHAAYAVEHYKTDLDKAVAKGFELTTIPHIGRKISQQINSIIKTGALPKRKSQPKRPTLIQNDLAFIKGLGPKRIAILKKELKITNAIELKAALKEGKLARVKGLGKKLSQQISTGMRYKKKNLKNIKLYHALPMVENFLNQVGHLAEIELLQTADSYRRRRELVDTIHIVIAAKNKLVLDKIAEFSAIKAILTKQNNYLSILLWSGLQIDIHRVANAQYGSALIYFTGSSSHLAHLQKLAKLIKMLFTEKGLVKMKSLVTSASEQEAYARIGLDFIPPELREDRGEIEAASEHRLPKLIELSDIKGDLHCHTYETDGTESLETMVEAAAEKGYEYIAITDHSKRLTITNGMDEKRLLAQIKLIDKLNAKAKKITILKSIEVDILEDGSLDLSDDVLKELDLCVCSVHSKFRLSQEQQTERIIRAMDNPNFTILGHATGRLLTHRQPYLLDMERILQAAKERGKFIELNAQPSRLDINDEYCLMAKKLGVKIAISCDAHSIKELNFMQLGIYQARRGWLEAEDVINTRGLSDLRKLLRNF